MWTRHPASKGPGPGVLHHPCRYGKRRVAPDQFLAPRQTAQGDLRPSGIATVTGRNNANAPVRKCRVLLWAG